MFKSIIKHFLVKNTNENSISKGITSDINYTPDVDYQRLLLLLDKHKNTEYLKVNFYQLKKIMSLYGKAVDEELLIWWKEAKEFKFHFSTSNYDFVIENINNKDKYITFHNLLCNNNKLELEEISNTYITLSTQKEFDKYFRIKLTNCPNCGLPLTEQETKTHNC